MKFIFVILLVTFSTQTGWALNEVFLAVEKNQITALDQKFEYAVHEDGNMQIGPIQINPSTFNIEPIYNEKNELIQLKVTWPKLLIQEGSITFKNSLGKEIWREPILSTEVNDNLATQTIKIPNQQTLAEIVYGSFFQFCLLTKDMDTNIHICSSEFYFESSGQSLNLKKTSLKTVKPNVFINGKKVDPVGIIILNKPTDAISLKAWASNRSYIELDTKHQKISLVEAYQQKDQLILRIQGADPYNKETLIKQEKPWSYLQIPVNAPFFYLKGQSNIPLKQEFILPSVLPKEEERIKTHQAFDSVTYASSIELNLKTSGNGLLATDKSSQLKKSKTRTLWKINNLKTHEENSRYLTQQRADKSQYFSYVNIFRDAPRDLSLSFSFPLGAQIKNENSTESLTDLELNPELKYWLPYSLGLYFSYATQKLKVPTSEPSSQLQYGLLYRWSEGTWNTEPGHHLLVAAEQFEVPGETISSITASYLGRYRPFYLNSYIDWLDIKATVFPYQSLSWKHTHQITPSFYIQWGLSLQYRKFQSEGSDFTITNPSLTTTLGTSF